jgi:hypothetical protein
MGRVDLASPLFSHLSPSQLLYARFIKASTSSRPTRDEERPGGNKIIHRVLVTATVMTILSSLPLLRLSYALPTIIPSHDLLSPCYCGELQPPEDTLHG